MVYCWKCGAENDAQAVNCKNCGALIGQPPRTGYRRRGDRYMYFEPRRAVNLGGIFVGLIILLAGLIWLMEGQIWWLRWSILWPLIIIVIGLMIIVNVFTRR